MLTALPSSSAPAPSTASLSHTASPVPALLTALSSFATALILLAALEWDYTQALRYNFLRTDCLFAGIAAATAATICLAGSMHFLARAAALLPRWYWRALIAVAIRLLMLAQCLTTALILGAAVLLIFDKPLPGSAREDMIKGLAPPPPPLSP